MKITTGFSGKRFTKSWKVPKLASRGLMVTRSPRGSGQGNLVVRTIRLPRPRLTGAAMVDLR